MAIELSGSDRPKGQFNLGDVACNHPKTSGKNASAAFYACVSTLPSVSLCLCGCVLRGERLFRAPHDSKRRCINVPFLSVLCRLPMSVCFSAFCSVLLLSLCRRVKSFYLQSCCMRQLLSGCLVLSCWMSALLSFCLSVSL